MKKFAIGVAFIGLIALSGCGKNDCDKAADVIKAGMDQGCSGKDSTCWYCDCYNKGQMIGDDGKSCKAIPTTSTSTSTSATCDGSSLTSAQTCLNDETACKKPFVDLQGAACDLSKK